MVPVHHKDDYRPCGERTIFTDDDFPSEKYNLWVASWDWPALHMDSCDWVYLWPTLCWCVQNWPSTKRISITLLFPWSHNLPQLGGLGDLHGWSHCTLDKGLQWILWCQLQSTPEVRMAQGSFMLWNLFQTIRCRRKIFSGKWFQNWLFILHN